MEAQQRLIVALDFRRLSDAIDMVRRLKNLNVLFKVGMGLLNAEGSPQVISAIYREGVEMFYDGKPLDIPNTVADAARDATLPGVRMFNIHTLGGIKMMKAARQASEIEAQTKGIERPLVLGVTILTHMGYYDLMDIGFSDDDFEIYEGREMVAKAEEEFVREKVLDLASLAQKAGLDGVVASALETQSIRQRCGNDFLIITPGIRPLDSDTNDQKRIASPYEAIKRGADYIVVGRPITQSIDPAHTTKEIIAEIERAQN
jgi:orotidine-5'-phosphate decarboxylase